MEGQGVLFAVTVPRHTSEELLDWVYHGPLENAGKYFPCL